jgi:SAM-dependent methyltransferase
MTKQLQFREAFLWEKPIEEFVKSEMKGYTLNVPCGKSPLGDVRLDIDPELSQREAYDMFKNRLPYENSTFDTVISDPPWHLGHYLRPRLFFELVRVLKVGGKIIYNAYWIPTSKFTKIEKTLIRQSGDYSNCSILSVHTKLATCPEELESTQKV